jgi:hypothetical protein
MPRPKKDLEQFKEYILDLSSQNITRDEITSRLQNEHNFYTTTRTLQKRLTEWRTESKRSNFTPSLELQALIAFFYSTTCTTDMNMLHNLRSLGYNIPNIRLLQGARRAMGLRRRMLTSEVEAKKE